MTNDSIQPGFPPPTPPPWRGKLSPDDLITLNEEIAGMARAGLPLDQGLAVLAKEMGKGRLRDVTINIANELTQGRTLDEAMQHQGHKLPPYYAALVTAGIRSGRLGDVLSTLTFYTRKMNELRTTIINSSIYPCIIFIVSIGIFTLLSLYLVPTFETTFRSLHMRLPLMTEVALYLGRHVVEVFVGVPLVITVLIVLCRTILMTSESGRVKWTRWIYALPLFGSLIQSARMSAFLNLLGILIDYEVPLPDAYRLASEASSDPLLKASTTEVEKQLRSGQPLSLVLREVKLVPQVVIWMAGQSEKRGKLGPTLHQLANMYSRQSEMRAALLRSVLPSALVILIAGFTAGGFVVAFILPLLQLLGGLSG